LSDEELMELGENGRRFCLKYHDYQILSKKFLDAISN
jgi:hypothetical protein